METEFSLTVAVAPVVDVFYAAPESQAVAEASAEGDNFVIPTIKQDFSQGQEKYIVMDDGTMFSTETGYFIAMHGTVEETFAAYGGESEMLFVAEISALAGDSQAVWEAILVHNGMTE